jgi:hypothetical protein
MLNTLKAMLLPSGRLDFEEELELDGPTPVLVTLLVEPRPAAMAPVAEAKNPLDWTLSTDERAVWDEFPQFRTAHPLRFASLKTE